MTAPLPLEDLFTQLEAAVVAGDRQRALDLERQIEQRIAANGADSRAQELRLRAMMARLTAVGGAQAAIQNFETNAKIEGLDLGDGNKALAGAAPVGVDYPVWFATNRKPLAPGGFGAERAATTTRGRVLVHVPPNRAIGSTTPWFWPQLFGGAGGMTIKETGLRDPAAFYAEIQALIQAARDAGDEPAALVYIHGFNVTFEEAAIRAAQIGTDLKVPGATAFFSWPSRGDLIAYPADEATIEASEHAIADFLVEFAKGCGTTKVHLIAHSMGNRGLLRALQRIAADAATRGKVQLAQLILAAPDVDSDLFVDLAYLCPLYAARTTLYASDADRAVALSAEWHGASRAGYFRPYTVAPGVDTIAVPNFNIDQLGHSYYAEARPILADMFTLISSNTPPGRRQAVSAATEDGVSFWRIA